MIYLDNAATSWPKPPGVARAMSNALTSGMGNPGRTSHRLSMDAALMVQECRENLARLFAIAKSFAHLLYLKCNRSAEPGDQGRAVVERSRDLLKYGTQLSMASSRCA